MTLRKLSIQEINAAAATKPPGYAEDIARHAQAHDSQHVYLSLVDYDRLQQKYSPAVYANRIEAMIAGRAYRHTPPAEGPVDVPKVPHVPVPSGAYTARPQPQQPADVPAWGGVGTEMLKLLAWTHWFVGGENCGCKAEAARWDRNGIEWCKANRGDLEERLLSMAHKYKIPTTSAIVAKLVSWAIRRAEKAREAAAEK